MPDVEFLVCARAAAAVEGQRRTLRARAAQLAALLEDSDESNTSTSQGGDDSSCTSSNSSSGEMTCVNGVRGTAGVTSKRPRPLREAEEAAWPAPKAQRRGKRKDRDGQRAAQQLLGLSGAPHGGRERDASATKSRPQHHDDDPVAAQPVQPSSTDHVVGYARVRLDATMLDRPSKLLVRPPKSNKSAAGSALGKGGVGGQQQTVAVSPTAQGRAAEAADQQSPVTTTAVEAPVYTTVQLGTRGAEDAALLRLFGTLGSLRFSLTAAPLATVQRGGDGEAAVAASAADADAEEMAVRCAAGGQTTVDAYITYQEEQLRATLDRVTAHGGLNRELHALFRTTEQDGLVMDKDTLPQAPALPLRRLPSTDAPPTLPAAPAVPPRGCALVQATFHPLDPILDPLDVRSYLAAKQEAALGEAVHQLEVLRRVRQLDPTSRAEWWTVKKRKMVRQLREKGTSAAAEHTPATRGQTAASPPSQHQPLTRAERIAESSSAARRRQAKRRSSSGGAAVVAAEGEDEADAHVPVVSVDALLEQRGGTLPRLLWSTHTAVALLVRTLPAAGGAAGGGNAGLLREWPTSAFAHSLRGVDPAQAVLWRLQQRRKRAFAESLDRWVAAETYGRGKDDGCASMMVVEGGGGTQGMAASASSASSFLTAHTHATSSSTANSEESAEGDDDSSGSSSASGPKGKGPSRAALPGGEGSVDAPDALAQTVRAAAEKAVRADPRGTNTEVKKLRPGSRPVVSGADGTEEKGGRPMPQAPPDANGFLWDRLCFLLREEDLLSLHVTVRVSLAPLPPLSTELSEPPAAASPSAFSLTPSASLTVAPKGENNNNFSGGGGDSMTEAELASARNAGDSAAVRRSPPTAAAAALPSSPVPLLDHYESYPTEDLCVCALSAAAVVQQLTFHEEQRRQQQDSRRQYDGQHWSSLSSSSSQLQSGMATVSGKSAGNTTQDRGRLVPLFMPCYRAEHRSTTTAATPLGGADGQLCGWLRVVLCLSSTFSLARLRALQARHETQLSLLPSSAAPVTSLFSTSLVRTAAPAAQLSAPPAMCGNEGSVALLPTEPPPQTSAARPCDSTVPEAVVAEDGETPAPMPLAFVAAIPVKSMRDTTHEEREGAVVRGHAYGGDPRSKATLGPAATAHHHPAVAGMEWAVSAAAASTASAAAAAAVPSWLSAPSLGGDGSASRTAHSAAAVGKGVEREALLCSLPTAPIGGLVLRVDQAAATCTERGGAALVEGHRYYAVVSFPSSRDVRGAAAAASKALPAVLLLQAPSTPAVREDAEAIGMAEQEGNGKHSTLHRPRRRHADSPSRHTEASTTAAAMVTAQWFDATYVLEACGPYLGLPLRVDIVELLTASPAAASTATAATADVASLEKKAAEASPRLIGSVVFHYGTLPFVGRHRFDAVPPLPPSSSAYASFAAASPPHSSPLSTSEHCAEVHQERRHRSNSGNGSCGSSQHVMSASRSTHTTVTLSWSISPELQQRCLLARLHRLQRGDLLSYAVTEEGVAWVWDRVPRCAATPSSRTAHLSSGCVLPLGWRGGEDVDSRDSGTDRGGAGGGGQNSITLQPSLAGDATTALPAVLPTRGPSTKREGRRFLPLPVRRGSTGAEDAPPLEAGAAAAVMVPARHAVATPSSAFLHSPFGGDGSSQLSTPLPPGKEREKLVRLPTSAEEGKAHSAADYHSRSDSTEREVTVRIRREHEEGHTAVPSPSSLPPLYADDVVSQGRQGGVRQPTAVRQQRGRRHATRPMECPASPLQRARSHRRRGGDAVDGFGCHSSLRLRVAVLALQNLRLPFGAATAGSSLIPYVVVRYQSESMDNYSLSLPAVNVSGSSGGRGNDYGGGGISGGRTLVYFTAEFDVAATAQCAPVIAVEVRDVRSRHLFGVAHLPLHRRSSSAASYGDVDRSHEDEGNYLRACGAVGETVTHVVPVYRPVQGLKGGDGVPFSFHGSGGALPVLGSPSPASSASLSPSAHAVLDVVAPVVGEVTVLTTLIARPSLTRRLAQQPIYMHLMVLGARGLLWQESHILQRGEGKSHRHALDEGARDAPDAYVVVTVRRCEFPFNYSEASDSESDSACSSSSASGSDDNGDGCGHEARRHNPASRGDAAAAACDGVWSTREYRSRTIPHHRSPLWYLEVPPLLCCCPLDVYTFTVYQADADGFDRCMGECRVTAGALLRQRQGREVRDEGEDEEEGRSITSVPQSLLLALRPRSDDAAAGADGISEGDGGCGSVLLEWSYRTAATAAATTVDAHATPVSSTRTSHADRHIKDSNCRGRSYSQLRRRPHRLLTAASSSFSATAAVVAEVQLVVATALALDTAATTQLRAHFRGAVPALPVVLATISLGLEGEDGRCIAMRDYSTESGIFGARSVSHEQRLPSSLLSAPYKVVVGTLRLDSGVMHQRWGCVDASESAIGGYRNAGNFSFPYTCNAQMNSSSNANNAPSAAELLSVDADFPSAVVLTLSLRSPPPPLRVQLWLRNTPSRPATTVDTTTAASSGEEALTPHDVFLGEAVVHLSALTPCTSPLQETTSLTTLLRPRRDPRCRTADLTRANAFPTGLGALTLRAGVYGVGVYEARQRHQARRSGWQAQLMVAVQEATDFDAAGVYAVEVCCTGSGAVRRSRVVCDRNPRFHETFAFALFAPTETVEVRLLEWPSELGIASETAGAAASAAAPCVVAASVFHVEVSGTGASSRGAERGGEGAVPRVHTAWLTLSPSAASSYITPASALDVGVSRAGVAPKLLVRWRARVCSDANPENAARYGTGSEGKMRDREGGEDMQDASATPSAADVAVDAPLVPATAGAARWRAPVEMCSATLSQPPPIAAQTADARPSLAMYSKMSSPLACRYAMPDAALLEREQHEPFILNVLWTTGELISFLGTSSSTAQDVIAFCATRSRRVTQQGEDQPHHAAVGGEETLGLRALPAAGSGAEADLRTTSSSAAVAWLPLDAPLLRFVQNGDYVQATQRTPDHHGDATPLPSPRLAARGLWKTMQDGGMGGGEGELRCHATTTALKEAQQYYRSPAFPHAPSATPAGGDAPRSTAVVLADLPTAPQLHLSRAWATPVHQRRPLWWLTDRLTLMRVSAAVVQRVRERAREALAQTCASSETVETMNEEKHDSDFVLSCANYGERETTLRSQVPALSAPPFRALLLTFLYTAVADPAVQQVVQWVQAHRAALSGFCRPVLAAVPQSFHVAERLFCVAKERKEDEDEQSPEAFAQRGPAPPTTLVDAVEVYVQGSVGTLYVLLCYLRRCRTSAHGAPLLALAAPVEALSTNTVSRCEKKEAAAPLVAFPHLSSDTIHANATASPPLLVVEEVVGHVPVLQRGVFQLASNAWEARQVWSVMAERPATAQRNGRVALTDAFASPALFYCFTDATAGVGDGADGKNATPGFAAMDLRDGCES